jgi:hypothetical protein
MTDRGLLEGIGTLHGLTYLRLTEGHNLTAQALCTFLHGPAMISIVLLNLSLCHNLDDEGLKGIATRCKKLICLHFKMYWCALNMKWTCLCACEVRIQFCFYLQMHIFGRIVITVVWLCNWCWNHHGDKTLQSAAPTWFAGNRVHYRYVCILGRPWG